MPKLLSQNNLNAGESMRGASQGLVQEHLKNQSVGGFFKKQEIISIRVFSELPLQSVNTRS